MVLDAQPRSGGTGRRAGLKIQWYLVPCGFDPLLRDHSSQCITTSTAVSRAELHSASGYFTEQLEIHVDSCSLSSRTVSLAGDDQL